MPVYHLYFSPCSSTYDTTYAFCRAISQNAAIEVNLTDRETEVPEIPAGSVAVVAAPVYAGRIPTPMADKLARARLEGVKVVTFAVYGGRAYEDALLELNDLCEKAGATVLASAATIAAHVFVPDLERGRPDANDFAEIKDFGRRVCEKCGASYHIINKKSKVEGVCDLCGGKTVIRKDDQPATVLDRLKAYHEQTEPLVDFYRTRGKLAEIKFCPSIEETTAEVMKALEA